MMSVVAGDPDFPPLLTMSGMNSERTSKPLLEERHGRGGERLPDKQYSVKRRARAAGPA